MNPTVFGIIGGGWRAEFYLRIASELPDRFRVGGMTVRDANKGRALEEAWHVDTYRTVDELLRLPGLQYVVISVPWPVTPVLIRELAGRGMPALAETPPAPDLEGLLGLQDLIEGGARVQVAEQYLFQPLHAARLQIVCRIRLVLRLGAVAGAEGLGRVIRLGPPANARRGLAWQAIRFHLDFRGRCHGDLRRCYARARAVVALAFRGRTGGREEGRREVGDQRARADARRGSKQAEGTHGNAYSNA